MKNFLRNDGNFLKNFYLTLNKFSLTHLGIFKKHRNFIKNSENELFSKGRGIDWLQTSERSLGSNYPEQSQS